MRPGDHVGVRVGDRRRGVAGLGLDHDRVGQERGAGGRLGELRGELAVGQVQRPLADEPGGGCVPEGGRAAVAERDLVAVRQAEELAQPDPDAGDQVLDRLLAVRGAHQVVLARQLARASGLTFEGPQPKRPSAGFSAAGISTIVVRVIGERKVAIGRQGSDRPPVADPWGRVAARPKGPARAGGAESPRPRPGREHVPNQL